MNTGLGLVLPGVVAFLTALVGTRVVMLVAARLAFKDQPGAEAHKQHARAVPYGGGVAIAVALLVGVVTAYLVNHAVLTRELLVIAGGGAVLLVIGLLDDRRPMGAWTKLALQALVAAVVVPLADLGVDSLQQQWPWFAFLAAWGWMVVITNAFNLIDHADGLSSTVAIISAVVLALGAAMGTNGIDCLPWLVFIGAVGGFLCWNFPPAKIYMGDAGSLLIGYLIAAGTLHVTFWPASEGGNVLALAAPVIIVSIPLFDSAVVVLRRWSMGRPIMQGDRNHIGHRLGRLGLSPRTAVAVVACLQTALAAGALQLRHGEWTSGITVLAQCAAILGAVVLLETRRDAGV